MLLEQMNWMQVEEYLKKEDRLVLVAGTTEAHGYYSVATDTQIPWELAKVACERENVILAPVLHYGVSPSLMAFPGTVTLESGTYLDMIEQILRSFIRHGFKRILILTGHGSNVIAQNILAGLREEFPDVMIKFRSWYLTHRAAEFMMGLGGRPEHHGSWIEGFPWINQFAPVPTKVEPDVDWTDYKSVTPKELRARMIEGTGGGVFARDEKTMRAYFQEGLEDVLEVLQGEWKP